MHHDNLAYGIVSPPEIELLHSYGCLLWAHVCREWISGSWRGYCDGSPTAVQA